MFNRKIKWFSLIELIIVIVLISIISVIALVNFGNKTAKARNAIRYDSSYKILTAFQLANVEEKIPKTSCLPWSTEYTLSGTVSGTWCHIVLNGDSNSKNFLKFLKINWNFQDPLNSSKSNDDFSFEFNYKLWGGQQEFVYLTEPIGDTTFLNSTYALEYNSWSLNTLNIDWNFSTIENSISPIYLKDKNWNLVFEITKAIKTINNNGKETISSFTNSETFKNKLLSFWNIKFNQTKSKNSWGTNPSMGENNGTPNSPYPFWFVNENFKIWDWKEFKNPSPENCFNFDLINDTYYSISQKKIAINIPGIPICDLEELVIPANYKGLPVKEIKESWFIIRQTELICEDKQWNQYPSLAYGWPNYCNKPAEIWSYSTATKNYCWINWYEQLMSSSSCNNNNWIYFKYGDGICKNTLWARAKMNESECEEKKQIELLKERTFSIKSYNFSNRVKSIVIPNTITKINHRAFDSYNYEEDKKANYKLNELIIPSSVETISNWAFFGIQANKIKFWENSNLKDLWQQTFFYSNIEYIEIPENLSVISSEVFLWSLPKMIKFLRNELTQTLNNSFWESNLSNKNENLYWTWILNSWTFVKQ